MSSLNKLMKKLCLNILMINLFKSLILEINWEEDYLQLKLISKLDLLLDQEKTEVFKGNKEFLLIKNTYYQFPYTYV